ncbi:Methyltransferase ausD [Mycena sanguinolenta]|uniref:Methyltransferase ausD n=1 Tax=Mycena sanguinolenta TaxID=230812 RepID=A0A8H6Z0H4_9AGAR|nr:Methyltransferase ausD [Mycena sanguinolenta]
MLIRPVRVVVLQIHLHLAEPNAKLIINIVAVDTSSPRQRTQARRAWFMTSSQKGTPSSAVLLTNPDRSISRRSLAHFAHKFAHKPPYMGQFDPLPLDDSFYREDKVALVREETGIQDPEALKQHIIAAQKKAYAVKGFPCIRYFKFAWERISDLPPYEEVLKLSHERDGAIFLDIGCCCGADIRRVARDGWPTENMIAIDLFADFWDVGHELFCSTAETFPVAFLSGDALDPSFLQPAAPLTSATQLTDSPPPLLASLTSLTPLNSHLSVIHVSSLFHLLSEPEQAQLAHSLAGLLSPLPGSLIFGIHASRETTGLGPVDTSRTDGRKVFCHSPESWAVLWEGIFGEGMVKVEVESKKVEVRYDSGFSWLVWSVKRI